MQLDDDQRTKNIGANHRRRQEPRNPLGFDWDSAIERLKRMLDRVEHHRRGNVDASRQSRMRRAEATLANPDQVDIC
jgi:hypothetical protein